MLSLDEKVLFDVENVIKYCKSLGKTVAIGHSLGGILALISSADFAIGISPALNKIFGEETQKILTNVRGYRVKEVFSGKFLEILQKLPRVNFNDDMKKTIIYGSRDIPEIVNSCNSFKNGNSSVIEIENAMHSDIFTLENTFQSVISQIKKWREQNDM